MSHLSLYDCVVSHWCCRFHTQPSAAYTESGYVFFNDYYSLNYPPIIANHQTSSTLQFSQTLGARSKERRGHVFHCHPKRKVVVEQSDQTNYICCSFLTPYWIRSKHFFNLAASSPSWDDDVLANKLSKWMTFPPPFQYDTKHFFSIIIFSQNKRSVSIFRVYPRGPFSNPTRYK